MWGAGVHGELAGNDPIHRWRALKPTLVNTPGAVTFKTVQVGFEFAISTTCKNSNLDLFFDKKLNLPY